MTAPVVEAHGLSKSYGARPAVVDLSFTVAPGECLGLLGPNGAGKSTTIKMLLGLALPSAGTLSVLGIPMTPRSAGAIKARLGVVQQDDSLDPDLTVEMNLLVYASYFGIGRSEAARRAAALIAAAELDDYRHAPIRTLSGGMRRRLMLGRALINEPALLVLDEPTTGLDPQARRLVWERIRARKRAGTTILLTTHYMEEATQLCDRLIIVDHGRILAEGRAPELITERVGSEVVEVYVPEDDDPEPVVTRLAGGPWRLERAGQTVYLYLRDVDPAAALPSLAGLEFTRRRATLEDVFLTLTGHSLRD